MKGNGKRPALVSMETTPAEVKKHRSQMLPEFVKRALGSQAGALLAAAPRGRPDLTLRTRRWACGR